MPSLAKIKHVVLDMDGTIYLGGKLFVTTLPFLATLKELSISYTFVTNNCSYSRDDYVKRLGNLGISVAPKEIETSAQATVHFLHSSLPKVQRLFVLGTTGLQQDLQAGQFEIVNDRPDAVIVGFDTELSYERLARAAYWLSQGAPFIATHPDFICPTDQPTVLPDCGAICALLHAATGRSPDAIPGKPNPTMLEGVLHRHHLQPLEIAVVGDRLYTDMRMARSAGACAVLTLTGEATRTQALEAAPTDSPDVVVADLAELSQLLRNSH